MNPAKLRRSWDVSEPCRVSLEKIYEIRSLAILNRFVQVDSRREESACQPADLIEKSPICDRASSIHARHIFSGGHPTASPVRGDLSL
jgi:hypothetical protein